MSDQAAASAAPAQSSSEGGGEEGQGSQGEGQQQQNATPQAPAKKPPQFRKYKVGDQEVALSDDDIARDYQKWKGADQKFREADAAKKSLETFMRRLEEDPEAVLNDPRLPINRRKLAETWLRQQVEEELAPKDPRDQRIKTYEEKLKEYEERDKKAQADAEAAEREAGKQASMKRIGDVLREAGKSTKLAAHPEHEAALVREMALYMRACRERDIEVTPQDLAKHIEDQRFNQFYTLAHQYEGDDLIGFLGEEIVKRIRQADLARLRAARNGGSQQHRDPDATPETRSAKPTRLDGMSAREHVQKKLFGK